MHWTVSTMTLSLPEIKQLIAYRPILFYATHFIGPASLYNAEAFPGIPKAPDTRSRNRSRIGAINSTPDSGACHSVWHASDVLFQPMPVSAACVTGIRPVAVDSTDS